MAERKEDNEQMNEQESIYKVAGRVVLRKGKEETLGRFHPWLFSGAIAKTDHSIAEGDLVEVCTSTGEQVALGHYAEGSIAIRVLSFGSTTVNRAFLCERLRAAFDLRQKLLLAADPDHPTTAFRLVHGEGDFLPGLVIDIYGSTAVLQAHSIGMFRWRHEIASLLPEATDGLIEAVYDKSSGTLPAAPGYEPADGFLLGQSVAQVELENGIKFYPDWVKGQKTGFFIDQRDNRALVERYARNRTMLNMFCYTGGFSLYALKGGAAQVVSVDSSAKAVYLVNQNVQANGWSDRHEAVQADAFRFLQEMPADQYDLIILDPPAFAKHRKVLNRAMVGYRKLNVEAFKKIKSGGILFTFSCSQAVSKEEFRRAVFTAAAMSGRRVRLLHQLTQPIDHPVSIYHPEGEYLKGLVLEVE